MHSRPEYEPAGTVLESNVTSTVDELAAAVVPLVGLALAHGRSAGAAQDAGASAMDHVSAWPSYCVGLEIVNGFDVLVLHSSAASSAGGEIAIVARQLAGRS